MENNRPRGRERSVTGPSKTVQKRGGGLGTGPVGDAGGYKDRGQTSAPTARSTGTGKNGVSFELVLLAVVLLLVARGLIALFGVPGQASPEGQEQSAAWVKALDETLGRGSVSTGWQSEANTGRMDGSVAGGSREKYTQILGGGADTATIMVYMCGTDLESKHGMATSDLQEMINAEFGGNVNLLVYTGGCKKWKNTAISSTENQIWQVKDGWLVCLEEHLDSVSMTDAGTLAGYIQWCAQRFPANRYELILWDHGGGSVSGYGYDEKFSSSGSMTLTDLNDALKTAGVKFDFIGFDACLMATVETAIITAQYADYLIASEETEPGIGWYYTDWLTAFGKDVSMPTVQMGKLIADGFVDTCSKRCPGQMTTLSVVDLAELEHTLPDALTAFSAATVKLLQDQQYQTVSDARNKTREFAKSSKLDQVDMVHLAWNMGIPEGMDLVNVLLSTVKYNRTSSNMTNAYGLSVYFPYRKIDAADQSASSLEKVSMDKTYIQCIRQFAGIAASGQALSGGLDSPLSALLGTTGEGVGDISALLAKVLGGRSLDMKNPEQFLTGHRFQAEALAWTSGKDGTPVLRLSEEQWKLVQDLELNLFYDDGAGYIDLGLDNVYSFDESGGLLGTEGGSWLAIEGQPVAYYHTMTVDDGETYSISGRVPVLHNGVRAELILTFDNDRPHGFVAGVQPVYLQGETATVAKSLTELAPGDTLEFLCDYYSYAGQYQDSYLLGDPVTVPEGGLTISDVPLEGATRATYRFTDLYNQHYWTPPVP